MKELFQRDIAKNISNTEKRNFKMKKQNCSNCYYRDRQNECPIPFEIQGQLSSTGEFYCPWYVEEENES